MKEQEQFLQVLDRDEAWRRFADALRLQRLPTEHVPLAAALGRVVAQPIRSPVDVPAFDRSNVDGYAVRSADTFGATELTPRRLPLVGPPIECGHPPQYSLQPGAAMPIATGGMLPRGADAVVMIEHTDLEKDHLIVRRPVTSGANLTFAGTDITAGELILLPGEVLSSRETGLLAAVGLAEVPVVRQPRVAVISTGDELIAPGAPLFVGGVYDSNGRMLADAIRETGGVPLEMGIVPDELSALRRALEAAVASADLVLLSGGTSKGGGDLCYRVMAELPDTNVLVHGVALKPGKPLCLAVTRGKGVIVLPGFPTSAIFTFHEFAAPVIHALGGRRASPQQTVEARLAVRLHSEVGRKEFFLVGLTSVEIASASEVNAPRCKEETERFSRNSQIKEGIIPQFDGGEMPVTSLEAWPMGKGSGSITTFSKADGFITLDPHQEQVETGSPVRVTLLAPERAVADLVVIGSHCIGLDALLVRLHEAGWTCKLLVVGSLAGLEAARRGRCDVAGVHLCDPTTGAYNRPFATDDLRWVPGWGREQGIVFRPEDSRFAGRSATEALAAALADPTCVMINRNAGSGTRLLIDRLLGEARPSGYAVQPRSHHAVAAAVRQGRADWGVCIASVARQAGLGFLPLAMERYDFLVPRSRMERPAVKAFLALLAREDFRAELQELGLEA